MRAVVLHGPGIAVSVPAPERYAVYKLVVSGWRAASPGCPIKAQEDVAQASELVEAISIAGRGRALGSVLSEAWGLGPQWRNLLLSGIETLPESARATIDDTFKASNARIPSPGANGTASREREPTGRGRPPKS